MRMTVTVLSPSAKSCVDDGDRDGEPDRVVDLEGQADADPVEERVRGQRDGRGESDLRVVVLMRLVLALVRAVQGDRALDDVQHEEAGRERHHRRAARPGTDVSDSSNSSGSRSKATRPEHHAAGEAEDQVQPVVAAQRNDAAERGREHGAEREEDGHAGNLAEHENHCHLVPVSHDESGDQLDSQRGRQVLVVSRYRVTDDESVEFGGRAQEALDVLAGQPGFRARQRRPQRRRARPLGAEHPVDQRRRLPSRAVVVRREDPCRAGDGCTR